MTVGTGVGDHLGEGRPLSKGTVVPGQLEMSALIPRMNRQGVEETRCGGAVGDRERVIGEEFVRGKLGLEHSVRHIEPFARRRRAR